VSNSIGNHTFCFLRRNDERGGAPELLNEQKSILRRPGTDGTSVRHEGKAGEPFSMRSLRDFSTADDAFGTIDGYKTTEEFQGPLVLIWNGINYSAEFGVQYVVLRVGDFSGPLRVANLAAPAVKLSSGANYILEATWVLLPVKKPTE
jgi:hypothetical protein